MQVRAVDVFAMLQSFLKKGQRLMKVTVYPSDYGLERMKEEARFGPQGLSSAKNGTIASEIDREGRTNGKAGYTLSKEERAAVLEALNEEEESDEGSIHGFSHARMAKAKLRVPQCQKV